MSSHPPEYLDAQERVRQANSVTIIGAVANLVLSAGKVAAGIFGASAAMVADGVHSASDLGTDLIVLVTMRMSSKPRDSDHQYGHGKYETIAALLVGAALLAVGVGLLVSSIASILDFLRGEKLEQPGYIALAAAAVSIVVKEILFRITRRVGRRIRSQALEANAWHHRSDAISSIGALVGIGGAVVLGPRFSVLDPIAGVIISLIICWVAIETVRSSLGELVESTVDPEIQRRVIEIAGSISGVTDPHGLRIRRVGSYVALDLHVRLAGESSINEGHRIAHQVEDRLVEELGGETIVTIHVEPERD